MSISASIREQLISSFRAELKEHVQTITDGLLGLEQGTIAKDQRQDTLENIFRAAHSLKGASRAMGVTMIEQLSHAMESILDAMQHGKIELVPALYTALYESLDAVQAVQKAYEAGEVTPPVAALQAIANLSVFTAEKTEEAVKTEAAVDTVVAEPEKTETNEKGEEEESGTPPYLAAPPPPEISSPVETLISAPVSQDTPAQSAGDETIRVSISKLDALMAQLNELLVTKIRAEQRLLNIRDFQELIVDWQREWLAARGAYGRLMRNQAKGTLKQNMLRPGPIEGKQNGSSMVGQDGIIRLGKDVLRLLDVAGSSQDHLRNMNTALNDLIREYANDTSHMSLVIDELEEEIKRVRMLPLSTITGSFGRMVRDLANESGKEIVLEIVGGETELDKKVLEQIKDPLIHLLRNAVDHAIEMPEGKSVV